MSLGIVSSCSPAATEALLSLYLQVNNYSRILIYDCLTHRHTIPPPLFLKIYFLFPKPRAKNNCWPLAVFRAYLPNGQPFPKVVSRYGQPYTCTDDYATIPLKNYFNSANLHSTSGYHNMAGCVLKNLCRPCLYSKPSI